MTITVGHFVTIVEGELVAASGETITREKLSELIKKAMAWAEESDARKPKPARISYQETHIGQWRSEEVDQRTVGGVWLVWFDFGSGQNEHAFVSQDGRCYDWHDTGRMVGDDNGSYPVTSLKEMQLNEEQRLSVGIALLFWCKAQYDKDPQDPQARECLRSVESALLSES